LAGQLGVISTPTLPVTVLPEAVAFYERVGFAVRVYTDPEGQPGDFAFVDFDGQSADSPSVHGAPGKMTSARKPPSVCLELQDGAVGVGDGLHDREAEAEAEPVLVAGPVTVEALEGLA
jgi:hypothetical protein